MPCAYSGKRGVTVVGNREAFAAVKVDGSVVTWGRAEWGGDSRGVAEQLSNGLPLLLPP